MPSVKVLRMIGAFEFFPWTFFGPCILVLLWRLGVLASWFFIIQPQTDTPPL